MIDCVHDTTALASLHAACFDRPWSEDSFNELLKGDGVHHRARQKPCSRTHENAGDEAEGAAELEACRQVRPKEWRARKEVQIIEHGAPPKFQLTDGQDELAVRKFHPASNCKAEVQVCAFLESLRRDGRFIYGAASPIARARDARAHYRAQHLRSAVARTHAFKATANNYSGCDLKSIQATFASRG